MVQSYSLVEGRLNQFCYSIVKSLFRFFLVFVNDYSFYLINKFHISSKKKKRIKYSLPIMAKVDLKHLVFVGVSLKLLEQA